ncbi:MULTISPECIES: gephyrin-like molybdotransferase Glp [Bacillaceae]|uniref:Molybdopterin molybdenumtransferase n=1 Tax=Evansella alkalicola TaxID=745819 RepID=A0ABS6JTC1_9BACI|nr:MULTISPECIES: gephyrin-like molybdotransferase Glp [Bacillaceae]MBU9721824.1 molybdopterin molybdotransferase MoeA [Bacillus alkalicola]
MFEERTAIKVSEAIKRVMQFCKKGEIEYINIDDAEGRYLGKAVVADHNIPSFDRTPLDGFAVISEDTASASPENPVRLEVIETVGAGNLAKREVKAGQAVRVMTGTMMPEECDAIAMFELTNEIEEDGKTWIELKRPFKKGDFVSFEGEETKKGDVLLEAGTKIHAGVIAVLATFGYSEVPVVKKPVIGIYATGTELLEVDEELVPGKIRNSNAYMIKTQVHQAGAEAVYYGQLADDFDQCYDAVKNTLDKVDALITTGGVSVGDFDYLPEIYQKLGANVLFNKIAMRPGSVTTVAEKDGKLLFGLSGNPSACFVGFELYTRPWVKTFLHSDKPFTEWVKGTLTEDFPKPNPFTRFIRSKISFEGGKITASPVGMDKSQVVTSLAHSDALVAVPGGTRGYKAGDEVDILLLFREGTKDPFKDPEKLRVKKSNDDA